MTPSYLFLKPIFLPLRGQIYSCDLIWSIGRGNETYSSHGTKVCIIQLHSVPPKQLYKWPLNTLPYLLHLVKWFLRATRPDDRLLPFAWLHFCNELYPRKVQRIKKVKSHLTAYQTSSTSALRSPRVHIFSRKSCLSVSKRFYSPFFIVKYYRWKKEVQHFREKWLAANIDCHCLEKQEGAKWEKTGTSPPGL